MAAELIFYTHPVSRGRMVRWMLEELQQPYVVEALQYGRSMKAAEYLAINPMAKVPAIRRGETVVTETAAIIAWLGDAFPQTGLAPPPASDLRGPYLRWLFFAAGPMEQAIVATACGWRTPAGRRAFVGFGTREAVMDTLESELARRGVLVGGSFTAADLYLAAQLDWAMDIGAFERRPAFEAWAAAHRGRPAARRAASLDDALLAQLSSVPTGTAP